MGFEEKAESQIAAALREQITPATEAVLRELEALRVALDVRYEAVTETVVGLRSASPGWLHEVIYTLARAAGEEAEAAAQIARGQALEQGQACLEFERAQAKERLELVEAEAAAQREADRQEQAALREALEEAKAQIEALRTDTRAQLEAARAEHTQLLEESRAQMSAEREEAERAATAHRQLIDDLRTDTRAQLEAARAEHTQVLEESRAQMNAGREEAERAATAHRQVVDDLRTQLEQARADLQQARTDADRGEIVIPAQPEVVRMEHGAPKQPGPSTQVTPAEVLGRVRGQLDRPAGSVREDIQPARDPQTQPPTLHQAEPGAAQSDPFSPMFSVLDEAATLTQALDALLDAIGAANGRAALFLVKPDKLQGWRSVGFESETAITPKFEMPLTADSVLTRAAATGRTIVTGNGPGPEAGAAHEPWAVALPVMLGERVAAVVYADEGAQVGNRRPPLDRAMALDVNERLARHAGRRLAVITATDRISDGDFKPEVPTTSEVPANSTEPPSAAERVAIDDAQRYARLLVSEMKRYYDADVSAGSSDGDLSKRLKDEIERCRRLYATRVPLEARSTVNLLDEAIFEMFGGTDVDVLRPTGQAGGTPAVGAGNGRPALAEASPRVET